MPLSTEGRALLDGRGISLETVQVALSEDAQRVGAAWFGMMNPSQDHCTLTFQMQKSRPTERAQTALDELVEAGLVAQEPFNQFGGVIYRPIWNFSELGKKEMKRFFEGDDRDPIKLTELIERPASAGPRKLGG